MVESQAERLYCGDSWATGKWGAADATGAFRAWRRKAGMNCVRFAVQARYVKPTPETSVASALDLPGPKFWAATHSPGSTYAEILDECHREGFQPVVTLLTSDERRRTGNGALPAYLGEPQTRYGIPVPKTLTELSAWEAFCQEVGEALEARWPGLVRRFEIWNGFQHCGTPAGYALLLRHAANGIRRALPDARLLANPAGTGPPEERDRSHRLAHLVQHCGDCFAGLVYQVGGQRSPRAEAGLPGQIRHWVDQAGGDSALELWQVQWRPRPPFTRPEGLTGRLHSGLFGLSGSRAPVTVDEDPRNPGCIGDTGHECRDDLRYLSASS